jgi:hypothetical protein
VVLARARVCVVVSYLRPILPLSGELCHTYQVSIALLIPVVIISVRRLVPLWRGFSVRGG